MSTLQNPQRRLKQKNSISTDQNSRDSSRSSIKIQIKNPNRQIQSRRIQKKKIVEEIGKEDSPVSTNSKNSIRLIQVPFLAKKRQDLSLFDTKNIDSFIKSNIGAIKAKSSSESLDSGEKDEQLQHFLAFLGQDKQGPSKLSHNQETKKSLVLKNSTDCETPGFKHLRMPSKIDKKQNSGSQDQLVMKRFVSMKDLTQQASSVDISFEPESFLDDPADIPKSIPHLKKVAQSQIGSPVKLGRNLNKQNDKSLMGKNEKGGRMTLRDYMFQTQVSSMKASNIEKANPAQENTQKKGGFSKMQKKLSLASPQYKAARFNISRGQMLQVLKNQILSDMRGVKETLANIQGELQQLPEKDFQPSDEDLLALYNARRTIKEHVSNQLTRLFEHLTTQKTSISQRRQLETYKQKTFAQI